MALAIIIGIIGLVTFTAFFAGIGYDMLKPSPFRVSTLTTVCLNITLVGMFLITILWTAGYLYYSFIAVN